ncbi:MAG: RidA family protein [Firmicutes bacterium]|nr:RidA family protein [Bacillota bacterium]
MENLLGRLRELGIELPPVPTPVAAYVPAVLSGTFCYTSGQLPLSGGQLVAKGPAGSAVSLEQAQKAARQCALNALSAAVQAAGDKEVTRIVKMVGFVAGAADYHDQPLVINGASELFQEIFQDDGRHARSAVGVSALPLDATVEVECIFEVR